jgi:cell volume regulation protein A
MESVGAINLFILLGAVLVLAGVFSGLVAGRFGAPLLLVFLLVGMLAGVDGPGGIAFEDYRATYLVGSVALALILFEGGLHTKRSRFRGALAPALVLATIGVGATAALTGAFAAWLLGLGWTEALLLGATVSSTDAAAVFFLLGTGGLLLRRRVGATLEIESGTNDPMAVFLTVVLVEIILSGSEAPGWGMLATLAQQALVGAAAGLLGGWAITRILNRVDLPGGLHPLLVAAGAVAAFAGAAVLGGSGFLAVYLAGLVVGNTPIRAFPAIAAVMTAGTWFCQIAMFVLLGLLVTPSDLVDFALPGLAVAAFLMFVARPLAVWLCLLPFGFTPQAVAFIAWVGLRGAVGIFLASLPVLAGLPDAQLYFNVGFFVVLASLVVQGWTIAPLARRLRIALRRTALRASRVELDLPGQLERELVGYPLEGDSPLLLGTRPLPDWAQPVLVARGGDVVPAAAAGDLQPGDYVYLLAPPQRVRELDVVFATRGE